MMTIARNVTKPIRDQGSTNDVDVTITRQPTRPQKDTVTDSRIGEIAWGIGPTDFSRIRRESQASSSTGFVAELQVGSVWHDFLVSELEQDWESSVPASEARRVSFEFKASGSERTWGKWFVSQIDKLGRRTWDLILSDINASYVDRAVALYSQVERVVSVYCPTNKEQRQLLIIIDSDGFDRDLMMELSLRERELRREFPYEDLEIEYLPADIVDDIGEIFGREVVLKYSR